MRLALLGFASVLLAPAVLLGQQTTPASQPDAVKATPPAATSVPLDARPQGDAIARGQAKAAEHPQKEKTKADAKAAKQAEKDKKEAEQKSKFLKLEDNEIVATSFDESGNALKLPPCAKDDKLCQEKRKELLKQKKVSFTVQNGTLTINGFVAKTHLNYDVKSFQYLYVSVPDYGTVVISPERFPNSSEMKDGLDRQTLTVTTADTHQVQLVSESAISGRQKRPLFYSVDRGYIQPGNRPTIGYGFASKAPYTWPAALPAADQAKRNPAKAPDSSRPVVAGATTLPCQSASAGASSASNSAKTAIAPQPCKQEAAKTTAAYSTQQATEAPNAATTNTAENHSR